jgi:glycolate oxidase
VDVVYVSNHGGRQLDHGRGSMEVLPEIVSSVAGRAKVYVDGGFYRGADVLKGIALGADLVVLGRLYVYGLAAAGSRAWSACSRILEDEIDCTMGLMGATSLKQFDRTFVSSGAADGAGPCPLGVPASAVGRGLPEAGFLQP